MNINNKIKQFFGKNWSANKYIKRHTTIPPNFGYEEPKAHSKKKKTKTPYRRVDSICPFCDASLSEVNSGRWRTTYFGVCKCGALVAPNCPCCKRKTCCKDGVYKHQGFINCGFEGRRRNG